MLNVFVSTSWLTVIALEASRNASALSGNFAFRVSVINWSASLLMMTISSSSSVIRRFSRSSLNTRETVQLPCSRFSAASLMREIADLSAGSASKPESSERLRSNPSEISSKRIRETRSSDVPIARRMSRNGDGTDGIYMPGSSEVPAGASGGVCPGVA
ncbi:hypothetical protein SDC9_207649 [bioreactor metagenome]|uniref:Uncharacterized protein n=1 Tax=bioreactor metagenome TaxID=1076179 RepID=A0A645J926_9ZZZZ